METGTKSMTARVRMGQWAVIMGKRRESGQTVRTGCHENGVAEKTYQKKFSYASEISWEEVIKSVRALYQKGQYQFNII